jgi:NAD+ diphosphatase
MTNSNDMPLAAKPINRAAHRRTDEAWLEGAIADPNVLIFLMRDGQPCIEGKATGLTSRPGDRADPTPRALMWLGPEALKLSRETRTLFMGEDTSGTPIFALDMPAQFDVTGSKIEGLCDFEDMRAAAGSLSLLESNLAATARSLFLWHDGYGFCAKCGGGTGVTEAGWKRQCPSCGAEHFPRTDPVAIMLATRGDKALIGRSAGWPAGFMSCLAGFCEPGETIEQAASRELFEEAGIVADPARAEYIACQPWPFPSSLMVGLLLPAENEEITLDTKELEAARWITREEARQIMAHKHPELYCPPPMAIAHHIMKVWAEREE